MEKIYLNANRYKAINLFDDDDDGIEIGENNMHFSLQYTDIRHSFI